MSKVCDLKYGESIYVDKLEEAYNIAKNGRCDSYFLKEFENLIAYAKLVPHRDYHYDIGSLIMKYYTLDSYKTDETFNKLHAFLFGYFDNAETAGMTREELEAHILELIESKKNLFENNVV